MYVYIRSEPQLWTVGFYTPDGEWIPESDYERRDDAAERVHWLNGGGKPSDIREFECEGPQENKYNYCPNCGVKFDEYVSYVDEEDEESEGEKMKPDGVSDNVYNDLINALDKAITLIYTILNMSTTSTRNAVVPWDTIHRWENLVKYAREKEAKLTNGKSIKCNYFNV